MTPAQRARAVEVLAEILYHEAHDVPWHEVVASPVLAHAATYYRRKATDVLGQLVKEGL